MAKEWLVGTSVRVPRDVLDRLEAVASRTRWSKGELHRQALEFYLSLLESGHFLAKVHWLDEGPEPELEPGPPGDVYVEDPDDDEEPR
jgi:predicted DNA-binding protein